METTNTKIAIGEMVHVVSVVLSLDDQHIQGSSPTSDKKKFVFIFLFYTPIKKDPRINFLNYNFLWKALNKQKNKMTDLLN